MASSDSAHLWHGAWAATLSLGLRHRRHAGWLRLGAMEATAVIVIGMLSIPIAVQMGWVR